jgi:hypothetical protein
MHCAVGWIMFGPKPDVILTVLSLTCSLQEIINIIKGAVIHL